MTTASAPDRRDGRAHGGSVLRWSGEALGLVAGALATLALLAVLVAVALIVGPFLVLPFALLVVFLVTRGLFR